jgi:hypothetical protein
MAGYLDEYGVADERRSRVLRWIVISVLVAGFLTLFVYLTLPLASGWWHVHTFVGDLRQRDYQAAYRAWGCAKPCPEYSFQEFLKDWGPKSDYANAEKVKVGGVRPCGGGIIVSVSRPNAPVLRVWYKPEESSLTFWPWQGCPSRIEAPATTSPAP